MEIKSNYSYFIETYELYATDSRKFFYRLRNHQFSIYEKRILEAYHLHLRNKIPQALELLSSFRCHSDSFLEAARHYFLGLSLNQAGEYSSAQNHLKKSVKLFESIKESEFIFYPLHVLGISLTNDRKVLETKHYLDKITSLTVNSKTKAIMQAQNKICYYIVSFQSQKGIDLIEKVMEKYQGDLGTTTPFYHVMNFILHFQLDDYENCYLIIDQYKNLSGCKIKPNFTFMKSLMDHLLFNRTLYVYKKDYVNNMYLFHQANVIKYLASGETNDALKHWKKLQAENPALYSDDFQYNGEKSLFSANLEKHQKNLKEQVIDREYLASLKSPKEKLKYLLLSQVRPIQRDQLIELIWNEEYSEITSKRLNRLVSKLNKELGKKIKNSQGSYWIEKEAA